MGRGGGMVKSGTRAAESSAEDVDIRQHVYLRVDPRLVDFVDGPKAKGDRRDAARTCPEVTPELIR